MKRCGPVYSQVREKKFDGATSSHSTSSQSQPMVDEDDAPLCSCGRNAKMLTSRTKMNPLRDFYICNLRQDDIGKCTYFKWYDEWVAECGSAYGRDAMWKADVNAQLASIMVEIKMVKHFVLVIFVGQVLLFLVFFFLVFSSRFI